MNYMYNDKIPFYEAEIYDNLFDYMDYKKDSYLLINLDAQKILDFFSQYLSFKIDEEEDDNLSNGRQDFTDFY